MKFSQLLTEECVALNLDVSEKSQAINSVVDLLSNQVSSEVLDKIRTAVNERESIMSTGVGKGLAIPHAKVSGLERNYSSFAILKEPIEYEAIDKQKVSLIFLMVGPAEHNSEHIKLLSRISRILSNESFRKKLIDTSQPAEVLSYFEAEEALHFPHSF